MKYQEPEYVQIWNKSPGIPRCCFLCGFFNNPACAKYGAIVPEEFARKVDVCPNWEDDEGVPF
ncbi:MAG: hypothetical protein WCU80_00200 [Paludibacteraceae bacterium]